MNSNPDCFMEYNTMNTNGEVISPDENLVSFVYNNVTKPMNTIVGYDTAKNLIYSSFFSNWDPAINYVPFPEGTDLKNIPADVMSLGKKKIILNNRLYIRNGHGAYISVLGL